MSTLLGAPACARTSPSGLLQRATMPTAPPALVSAVAPVAVLIHPSALLHSLGSSPSSCLHIDFKPIAHSGARLLVSIHPIPVQCAWAGFSDVQLVRTHLCRCAALQRFVTWHPSAATPLPMDDAHCNHGWTFRDMARLRPTCLRLVLCIATATAYDFHCLWAKARCPSPPSFHLPLCAQATIFAGVCHMPYACSTPNVYGRFTPAPGLLAGGGQAHAGLLHWLTAPTAAGLMSAL